MGLPDEEINQGRQSVKEKKAELRTMFRKMLKVAMKLTESNISEVDYISEITVK